MMLILGIEINFLGDVARGSGSMKFEMKPVRKRKIKVIYLGSKRKGIPGPSHIYDTMEGNPSLDKSLGEGITSPTKEVAKGVGKMGNHHHGEDNRKTRLDRLEKSIHDLIDNQKTLYQKFGTLVEFTTKVMHRWL